MKPSPFHGMAHRRAYRQQSSSRWPARGIALLLLSSLSACGSGTGPAAPPSTDPIPAEFAEIVAPAELNRDFVSVAPEANEIVTINSENIIKNWEIDSIKKPNGDDIDLAQTTGQVLLFYETYVSFGIDLNICSESEWFWNYRFTATTLHLTREAAVLPMPRPVRTANCPGPNAGRPVVRDLLRNGARWSLVRGAPGEPDALILTGTSGDTEGWVVRAKVVLTMPMPA